MTTPPDRLTAALAGRYTIERELGAGGMATVYLARDVKHERQVALKVLRPELAAVLGGERFLQEIKTTANLQHPNILPLYDSGEADSYLYYVMPYLEGESLRDMLEREKQIGVEETVELAKQVCAALEFAHERGVVHRDIKPENIMMQAGQAIVADFGIALAVSQAGGTRMTETGLSLGTPHYMSPEQAIGDRDVDARSDVYSLGALLYEMLVGEPPHVGNSVQAIVAKILTDHPAPITRSRQLSMPNVEAAVLKALAKSPADRFSSAAEFATALTNPAFTISTAALQAGAGAPPSNARWLVTSAVLAALSLVLVVLLVMGRSGRERENLGPIPFALAIPSDQGLRVRAVGTSVAISPDGRTLVWVGPGDPELMLYRRDIGDLAITPIRGTEGGEMPFFSPDGRWLAFRAGNRFRKVDPRGGPVTNIVAMEGSAVSFGATWVESDTIYYAAEASRGMFKVSADGSGTPELETRIDTTKYYSVAPAVSGSDWLLIIELDRSGVAELKAFSVRTGETRPLTRNALGARYLASGHLLVVFGDGTAAVSPFDPADPRPFDNALPVLENVAYGTAGAVQIAVSQNGTLFYVTGGFSQNTVVLVDRQGRESELLATPRAYKDPRFSPDGERLAFEVAVAGGAGDIWQLELATGSLTRLTLTDGVENLYPVWTPDGRRIAFTSRREGLAGLWWKAVDGSGEAEQLLPGDGIRFPNSFAPDGNTLLFREISDEGSGFDIYALPLVGGRVPVPVRVTSFNESSPELSPDGRWLAYVSDESGANEVYVQAFPEGGARWSISSGGGTEPVWSPDGRELFYRNGPDFMAARLELGANVRVTGRDVMFTRDYYQNVRWPEWDIDPTGTHFVLIKEGGATNVPVVVLNWFEELEALLEDR